LDGSPFGAAILPVAANVAHRLGATLRLVHVVEPPILPSPAFGSPLVAPLADLDRRTNAEAYLSRAAGRVREMAPVDVVTEVLEGDVVAQVIGCATARGAGLIVMSTHGRGGIERMLMGSIADELVRRSPLPVFAVRPDAEAARRDDGPLRALLPLDGSLRDDEILAHARVVGRALQAELHLVQVVVPRTDATRPSVKQIDRTDLRDRRREASAYLGQVAAHLEREGFSVTTHVLAEEDAAAGILTLAAELDAGLIAMATRGMRGWDRLKAGSIADQVLQRSERGVLLVRSG
jgi:nucleotide-binding universal stress UspA family protein